MSFKRIGKPSWHRNIMGCDIHKVGDVLKNTYLIVPNHLAGHVQKIYVGLLHGNPMISPIDCDMDRLTKFDKDGFDILKKETHSILVPKNMKSLYLVVLDKVDLQVCTKFDVNISESDKKDIHIVFEYKNLPSRKVDKLYGKQWRTKIVDDVYFEYINGYIQLVFYENGRRICSHISDVEDPWKYPKPRSKPDNRELNECTTEEKTLLNKWF